MIVGGLKFDEILLEKNDKLTEKMITDAETFVLKEKCFNPNWTMDAL
jgi:hypothetical protein